MSTSEAEAEACIFCKEGFDEERPLVKVKEKGMKTLVRLCRKRKLDDLLGYTSLLTFIFRYLVP